METPKSYDTTVPVTKVSSSNGNLFVYLTKNFADSKKCLVDIMKDALSTSTTTVTVNGYANKEHTRKAVMVLLVNEPFKIEEVQ